MVAVMVAVFGEGTCLAVSSWHGMMEARGDTLHAQAAPPLSPLVNTLFVAHSPSKLIDIVQNLA